VRVVAVHRSGLQIVGAGIDEHLPPRADATVGDWLLLDRAQPPGEPRPVSEKPVKRRAPGTNRQVQLIAANIDTAFVVTSCNQDFNLARLERYVALAFEAEITPVIVLTKADLVTDLQFLDRRCPHHLGPGAGRCARRPWGRAAQVLSPWCKPGRTVAFLGSSGVGKSTLTNALAGTDAIATQAIREDDARGRHTTTRRELHLIPGGCLVLDTPGMRELQLADAASGIADTFEDIQTLSAQCRFGNCQHENEPGCAVRDAIEHGRLDPARLASLAQAPGGGQLQLRESRRAPDKRPRIREDGPTGDEGDRRRPMSGHGTCMDR
jgi:ribosome biogenesis GTPase / thiamine phosphate phosphatase